ncbi:Sca4 family protein [Candidatus Tisiphia endosymbiont of Melanophora roralis]|uniref:Sca4 family protein n=1 Tax=Candidatus Tisiphia endosymbiont of Melanophora roralis TaxID=3066261 RepID=UPI00312C71EF
MSKSEEKNPREYFDYYTDLMIEIDKAGEKVDIQAKNDLVEHEVVDPLFNHLLEIPNRVLENHYISKELKVVVVNDVLDGLAEAIKTNADECKKIGEKTKDELTEQDKLTFNKFIVFDILADKLQQSMQSKKTLGGLEKYEDKLQAIIASTKEEPAQEELAQDVFVLQGSAEENLRELEEHSEGPSFDSIRTSSFSAADLDVDPITQAIRNQILTKQRELIVEALVKNNIAKLEEIGDITKFRAYCENEENKEKISEVLRGVELKRALEQVEIAGYKNVHTQFADRFSTMEWKDGVGGSANGITTKTQIVRDANGNEIATLTEATHQINPPQTVQKSDGTPVEIKNYRTIDFPIELNDGGPMHLSLAVKDQHGRNIAASKAVYFTAHYDDDGRLIEVSSPRPVKFNGTGSDAVGYIEHGGHIYTLPVTQEKYKAMMQEVAKNKGHGVDISQSIDTLSVDRIITSPQKTEELGRTKEAVVSLADTTQEEEVNARGNILDKPLDALDPTPVLKPEKVNVKVNPRGNIIDEPKPTLQNAPVLTPKVVDNVRTASRLVGSKSVKESAKEVAQSLRKNLATRVIPSRKTNVKITAQAEEIYKNLQKNALEKQKQYINEELKKLSTPQEQIKLLMELAKVEADGRGERVKEIGSGGEREANVGQVRLRTEERITSINGSPKMGYQRQGEHVNVKDDVNLQKFLNDRIVEINQESQKSALAFKTRKVGGHGLS